MWLGWSHSTRRRGTWLTNPVFLASEAYRSLLWRVLAPFRMCALHLSWVREALKTEMWFAYEVPAHMGSYMNSKVWLGRSWTWAGARCSIQNDSRKWGAVLNREGSAGFIRDLILFDTGLGCMCIFPILQMWSSEKLSKSPKVTYSTDGGEVQTQVFPEPKCIPFPGAWAERGTPFPRLSGAKYADWWAKIIFLWPHFCKAWPSTL